MKRLEELKITPAPWQIENTFIFPYPGGYRVAPIIARNGGHVSTPRLRDACLIVTAPKMYEEQYNDCLALRTIVNKLREGSAVLNLSGTLEKMANRMEAVLAEAAGEGVADVE